MSTFQSIRLLNQASYSPLRLTISHLKKFTKYSVVVQAFNKMGAGPRNEAVVVTTGEDGEWKNPNARHKSQSRP